MTFSVIYTDSILIAKATRGKKKETNDQDSFSATLGLELMAMAEQYMLPFLKVLAYSIFITKK